MRTIGAVLAFAAAAAASAAGLAATPKHPYRDGCSPLAENPARGLAPGIWHVLGRTGNAPGAPEGFCSWLWNIGAFSGGNQYGTNAVPYGVIGGSDAPLTSDALAAVSNTLVNARANGAVMIVRFGYTSGSEKGAEPTDFNTVTGHVGRLGRVLGAFPDVVLAVECGMVGPWGEMHSSNYCDPAHIRALVDTWLATLPESTALLVRNPMWILEYAGKNVGDFMSEVANGTYCTTQPAQGRIGMFNDGYLGSASDYGTWRAASNWMTREQGVVYLEARRNVPYGGELAYLTEAEADDAERDLFDPARYNIVREFYRTHLSYLRNIDTRGHLLAGRIENHALTHDYDFGGMPDLSEWYGRDLRSFIRAHMGYRFVVRGVEFSGGTVEVSVENTGFGHLLVKSKGEISVGEASRAVELDLRDLKPGEVKTYLLPLPDGADTNAPILLTVRLDTPAAQAVHFANDAMRLGDATCLRGVQRVLGGLENESNVGSESHPVAWGDAANWTPTGAPCGMDVVNWAPPKENSRKQAYVVLDRDYEIGWLTNKYRTVHLYRATGAAANPVTFTINGQLGDNGYHRGHTVNSGVRLVLPTGSSMVCSRGDHDWTGISVMPGGRAEVRSDVQSRVMKLELPGDGGELLFAPSSYTIPSWGRSDGDHDEINICGGKAYFPNGIAMTGSASTPGNQVNQTGGEVSFGGDFTSEMPWTYTWSGGTLAISDNCAFGANVALTIPANSNVTLDIAKGKAFSAPTIVADSTVTITVTGGGAFTFGPTSARIVVKDSGTRLIMR
jgi:hypothetical protein